jgi:hypothetical protein
MELAIHDELDKPFIESLGAQSLRIHFALGMTCFDLLAHFENQLDADQANEITNLMTNDSHARQFETNDGFVVIRSA